MMKGKDLNNLDLSLDISWLLYKTLEYSTFKIRKPKEKLIFRLLYYLDRIMYHAIFPVDSRGIDFVGYKFFHTHTLLRKSIKLNIKKLINSYKKNKIDKDEFKARMSSYFGWLKFCDSKHFLHKIEEETGLKFSNWNSDKGRVYDIYNQNIYIVEIVTYSQYFQIHYTYHNKSYFINSRNKKLYSILSRYILPNYFKIKHYERACKNTDKCLPKDNSETGQRNLLLPF